MNKLISINHPKINSLSNLQTFQKKHQTPNKNKKTSLINPVNTFSLKYSFINKFNFKNDNNRNRRKKGK